MKYIPIDGARDSESDGGVYIYRTCLADFQDTVLFRKINKIDHITQLLRHFLE